MKEITRNEFYRLKIQEFLLSLEQVKCLSPNHNLSIGLYAESILRKFLQSVLPQKVSVSQGFVEREGKLSAQCDIIIYDKINYAPLYSFGDFEIIPHDAVICVIEVKTSIDKKTFGKVLFDFEKLYMMGVQKKYLFIFESCKCQTLHDYFFGKYVPHYKETNDNVDYRIGLPFYDYDSYEYLPEAIISLSPDYYFGKDDLVDEGREERDGKGYIAYTALDNSDGVIVGLQTLVNELLELVIPPNNKCISQKRFEDDVDDNKIDDLKDLYYKNTFFLFD